MTASAYLPDTGHLIWTDFDPTRGREQAGRRPALVVSPAAFTHNTRLAIVCPITSRVRPFPTSVVLPPNLPITGEVLTSHIRSIDIQSPTDPVCRRRRVERCRPAGPGESRHLHHDLRLRAERDERAGIAVA